MRNHESHLRAKPARPPIDLFVAVDGKGAPIGDRVYATPTTGRLKDRPVRRLVDAERLEAAHARADRLEAELMIALEDLEAIRRAKAARSRGSSAT